MEYFVGFSIAFVIALTGVGAGVITAPLLFYMMGLPLSVAVSTALAYSAIVKLIIVPVQVFRRQVNYRVLGWMVLGGLPGVIIGSLFFRHVTAHGPRLALMLSLGLIIIFTSTWHIYRQLRASAVTRPTHDHRRWLSLIMLPIAAEVGFSSSGAGALGTVSLLGLTDLSTSQVVGTDLAFGLVITLVGSGVHWFGGQYATAILLKMAIGGILGGIAGSIAAPKIPSRYLRLALSAWLILIGFKFCWDAFFMTL
ncbi:MAG: sulfite exporter TauE/SafE family protein [Bryocella sp.]